MSEPRVYEECELSIEHYADIMALWQRAGLHVAPEGRDAPDAFAQQMTRGIQRVIGTRCQGALVGVAVLTHDGRKGWINRLAVDPAHRRRGVAEELIGRAEQWFTQDVGLDIWAALIVPGNEASLALFEHAGYERYEIVYVRKKTRADV